MAYLQTTATSVSDILNTIAAFATGLGWTVHRNDTHTSGSNTRRILSIGRAGADYAHFYSQLSNTTKTDLFTMRSIGLSTTGDYTTNPQRSTYSTTNTLSGGPYVNFWLFGESGANPYIHCVMEHASGRYRHFGIGELVKKGVWTGGSYCYGHEWDQSAAQADQPDSSSHNTMFGEYSGTANNGSIRCNESDATANNISGVDNSYLPYYTSSSRRAMTGFRMPNTSTTFPYVGSGMGLQNFTFSNYNQRVHLIRLKHFVTVAGGYRRHIGEPNALRAVNINPFQAGEEFNIGSDVWKVFPMVRKGILTDLESSDYYGVAYKKVI
jgi:hypothetical protein